MTPDEHNPEGTDHAAQGHALAASKATPPVAAPTPALPPEVREAIDAAAKKINWRLNTTHYVDIAGIIRDELAPLWPRPALVDAVKRLYLAGRWECQSLSVAEQVRLWEQVRDAAGIPAGSATSAGVAGPAAVTADARELAEKCIAAYAYHWPSKAESEKAVAAVLAPVLARAEAAERERDQLRAQLAAAQEALERIATYDAPDTQAMIEIARAARREGGAK